LSKKIMKITDFKFRENVEDPYLARMHHIDYYPKGNGSLGVREVDLEGKSIGEDFDLSSKWKMYYGKDIPGFPEHPHRGFETITVVLQGYVDHSDSAGGTGRYSAGDVQWMTAGSGMKHSEMFPLMNDNKENTMELFQIWLNLPSKDKFADPCYKMLWSEDIPAVVEANEAGNKATINIIAGNYNNINSLDPNPDSWAYNRENHVGIWTIHFEPGASFTIPSISSTLNRNLYLYKGGCIKVDDTEIKPNSSLKLVGDENIKVVNGNLESYLILIEGEPINEPVVNQGPFVMNTQEEIIQAYSDYQATQFGGWPWDRRDPVNPKNKDRFAKYNAENIEIR